MRSLPALLLLCISSYGIGGLALAASIDKCRNSKDEFCEANVAEAEFRRADRQLNDVYAKLMRQLADSQKKELVVSQRAWVEFRRLDCDARDRLIEGGAPAIHQVAHHGCMKNRTIQRVRELKEFCEITGGCR